MVHRSRSQRGVRKPWGQLLVFMSHSSCALAAASDREGVRREEALSKLPGLPLPVAGDRQSEVSRCACDCRWSPLPACCTGESVAAKVFVRGSLPGLLSPAAHCTQDRRVAASSGTEWLQCPNLHTCMLHEVHTCACHTAPLNGMQSKHSQIEASGCTCQGSRSCSQH